jgi:hypothetical protein
MDITESQKKLGIFAILFIIFITIIVLIIVNTHNNINKTNQKVKQKLTSLYQKINY